MPSAAYVLPLSIARKIRHLESFLRMPTGNLQSASHVVGWGYKATGRKAVAIARREGLKPLLLEDGFLAVAPGMDTKTQRLSLVVDDNRPYFDTTGTSRLEQLIRGMGAVPSEAHEALALWKMVGAAKYGHLTAESAPLPHEVLQARAEGRPVVVLLDQIRGDASLHVDYAGRGPFERMLELARARFPQALLVIKPHPRQGEKGMLFGVRRGCLDQQTGDGLVRCAGTTSLKQLCSIATQVFTVTSHAGFECLLWGASVTCVGHPWYAGWGATDDSHAVPARRSALPRRSVEQLFWAAYGQYSRYVHPATGQPISLIQALQHLQLQYETRARTPSKIAVVDCQYWKRQLYRDFLPAFHVRYVSRRDVGRNVGTDWALVSWGQRIEQGQVDRWRGDGFQVLQAEDGFLRSVGLGCELARPLSLCFDEAGLYADPRTDSTLLRSISQPMTALQVKQTERFLKLHHDLKLTKYLLPGQREALSWRTAEALSAARRPILLLCGQVSDDVSVRSSGCLFASFERLAQELKRTRPDAFLVYRPHPDVVRGLRPGELEVASADLNDSASPTRALLELVDEVHVVNSLVGFEALLLDRPVHTWGRSWYAGWGLTHDHLQERRSATATLLQLAHAAFLVHPRYFEPSSSQFISPCAAAEVLAQQREQASAPADSLLPHVLKRLPGRFARVLGRLFRRGS